MAIAGRRSHCKAGTTELSDFSNYSVYKLGRKVVIGLVGGVITLTGIALLVLPGPAFIVLPLGLAVLSAEFIWARRLLRKLRDRLRRGKTPSA